MDFDSHLPGVVHAIAGIVNVLCPGERQGRRYDPEAGDDVRERLGEALRASTRSASDPRPRDLDSLRSLAVAAREVFVRRDAGDQDGAAAAANGLLRTYAPTPELTRHDDEPWHLHFHGPADRDPTGWGGGAAVALATVLGGASADRLGVCQAPACDRVFVDVSRNGTRRFCSESCQSRVKAAAHRARMRAQLSE